MAAAVVMAPEPKKLWEERPLNVVGLDSGELSVHISRYQKSLPMPPGLVIVSATNPIDFLIHLLAALINNNTIALGNPSWGEQEWRQVSQKLLAGKYLQDRSLQAEISPTGSPSGIYPKSILIPTSGTTGQPRFVIHTWETLVASAQGFLEHFGVAKANVYCVLPLFHVSGLMQVIRAWISGGQIVIQPFKDLLEGEPLGEPNKSWFISLVPTQLQRLLRTEKLYWLKGFQSILLGGAPAWPSLLESAADFPISLTYGMSETAAQIATLLPESFAMGNRSSGPVLPHAHIDIISSTGTILPAGNIGQLRVRAKSLAVGYWGEPPFEEEFYPDDVGYLDPGGHLHILGRNSQKIITGGENVFPAEIEATLLTTGQVEDICVLGVPDAEWGQAVAAVYVPSAATVTPATLKQSLVGQLSTYKHPKRWIAVAALPRNAQGKLNRQQVLALTTDSASGSELA